MLIIKDYSCKKLDNCQEGEVVVSPEKYLPKYGICRQVRNYNISKVKRFYFISMIDYITAFSVKR